MLSYSDIGKYEALIEGLSSVLNAANAGSLAWTRGIFKRVKQDAKFYYLDAYLHMQDWKWRGSTHERIHVLVEVKETIRKTDKTLEKSTINVDYYAVADGAARRLQSVHFDFAGTKDCHPLFHAQFCENPISLSATDASEVEFEYPIDPSPLICFGDARIPTSDMTLPSVLVCLAADRLHSLQNNKHFFGEFRKIALEMQSKMPRPPFQSLAGSLETEVDHFCSSHWFAHT